MVGAVELGLLFEEFFLNDGEEGVHRVEERASRLVGEGLPGRQFGNLGVGIDFFQAFGDVAGKGGKDGTHVELALAGRDFLLQLELTVEPRLREGSLPGIHVGHAVPGQMGGACEVGSHLLVGDAELGPHLIPDGFLAGDSQRQIHAVEGHPVDEVFPIFPLPPGHSVAESAVVEEKAVVDTGFHRDRFGGKRKHLGKGEARVFVPAKLGVAQIFEIMVQAHGHGVGIVAGNHHFAAIGGYGERIGIAFGDEAEFKFPGTVAEHAPGKVARRRDIVGKSHDSHEQGKKQCEIFFHVFGDFEGFRFISI